MVTERKRTPTDGTNQNGLRVVHPMRTDQVNSVFVLLQHNFDQLNKHGGKKETPEEKVERVRQFSIKRWADESWRAEFKRKREGVPLSDVQKKNISVALTGVSKSETANRKESIAKGGVKVRVYPLLLRGISIDDILAIWAGQVTRLQVEDCRDMLRRRKVLQRPTKDQESEAKRKAHLGKPRKSTIRSLSNDESVRAWAVRALIAEKFIGGELSAKNSTMEQYSARGEPFPVDPIDQLLAEAALIARRVENSADQTDRDTYFRVIDKMKRSLETVRKIPVIPHEAHEALTRWNYQNFSTKLTAQLDVKKDETVLIESLPYATVIQLAVFIANVGQDRNLRWYDPKDDPTGLIVSNSVQFTKRILAMNPDKNFKEVFDWVSSNVVASLIKRLDETVVIAA